MSDKQIVEELDLSDADIIELIKNHGIGRRTVMKVLGAGTALSLGAGSAAAKHDNPHPPHIDSHYGYSTPDADDIPKRLEPDHEVELHIHPPDPSEQRPPVFHFEPTGLAVDRGDIVQFTSISPDHTVTPYHQAHGFQHRVPDGVPPFSSPIVNTGGAWLYQFDVEGLYDMYCGPHHLLGMVMRIVVGELGEDDIPDYEDTFEDDPGPPPLLAPFSKETIDEDLRWFTAFIDGDNVDCEWIFLTPKEILDTDALNPDKIQEDGEVPFVVVLDDIDRANVKLDHG